MKVGSTLDDLTDQLAADGFVLLPERCSSEFLNQVLEVSCKRVGRVQEALGTREIGIGSAAGFDEIVQRSPGRWDIPITPQQFGLDDCEFPWSAPVRAILGADAEHSFSGVVFSDPDSPAQCWHTDSPHIAAEHLAPHAINVLVALHDIPMDMGPTEIARGSHFLTNHLSNPSLVPEELIYQHKSTSPELLIKGTNNPMPENYVNELAAGSCIVFDDRVMHRGLGNRSDSIRHMAYFSYRKKGYSENTHFESQRSVFDATS
jgi:hypothetical protein